MNNKINNINNCGCNSLFKAIPLAFDDSLSYYEYLCKLTTIVNQIIKFINGEMNAYIKKYIDENFNNIMINASYDESTETLILYKEGEN